MSLTLKAWRRAREISQADMATKLNVCVNTYQNWEKRPETISIENSIKICQILGVSLNDVVFVPDEG